ncbi:hypothetical protein [Streptomyces subrutilus]|uniref:hypothetical protein n=1 Tax=Streptomyces subrutilus TaxID=36818 RepID=UPI0034050E23
MANELDTVPIHSLYAERFAADLETNRKEQADVAAQLTELEERLRQLKSDETWLSGLQGTLPGDAPRKESPEEAVASKAVPRPRAARKASAGTTRGRKAAQPGKSAPASGPTAPDAAPVTGAPEATAVAATRAPAKAKAKATGTGTKTAAGPRQPARTAVKSTATRAAKSAKSAPKSAAKDAAKVATKGVAKAAPESAPASAPKAPVKAASKARAQAPAKAAEQQTAPAPVPASTATGTATAKPAEPPLRELALALLVSAAEPRMVSEVTTALAEAHPERAASTQVVRNTLETLAKKGVIDKEHRQGSVMYTAHQPPAGEPAPVPAVAPADDTAAEKTTAEA